MKAAILMATGLVALTASFAVHADQKVDRKFCAAAASFQSNVAELKTIGPQSTVGEVRSVRRRLDDDAAHMHKTANRINTPAANKFTEAMSKLDWDVSTIPNDQTLEQVHSRLRADVDNAQSAGRVLATEAGCDQPSR